MKKKTRNILCVGLLLITNSLFAQNKIRLGLDAGYTYSSLDTDVSNLIDSEYKGRYGFGINFSAEMSVWNSLFVSSGLSFMQKNYEFKRTGTREGWYTKYDNNFLQLPILIGGYLFNDPNNSTGIYAKIAGGMYFDYWLSMKRNGQYPVFSELQPNGSFNYTRVSDKYDFSKNENELRRFGVGLEGLAQVGYSFDQYSVYANYEYQYGLTDMNKNKTNGEHKATRNMYMISVGVAYNLK